MAPGADSPCGVSGVQATSFIAIAVYPVVADRLLTRLGATADIVGLSPASARGAPAG